MLSGLNFSGRGGVFGGWFAGWFAGWLAGWLAGGWRIRGRKDFGGDRLGGFGRSGDCRHRWRYCGFGQGTAQGVRGGLCGL
ncbi:MAG TPA: hypothetical protein DDX91_03605 [Ruminococcaceae bacterium]|nr:hypothetical protein [Oscillospiraceae bacterium]